MTEVINPNLPLVHDFVGRARKAQEAVNALGAGPLGHVLVKAWHDTGMRATVGVEVAVVRGAKPARCEVCHHRRVLYALTITTLVLGNPEHPWRCAPCWGLR